MLLNEWISPKQPSGKSSITLPLSALGCHQSFQFGCDRFGWLRYSAWLQQTHFHKERGIGLSSDFLAFGHHLILRLSVSCVANRCCHTVFVNPANPGLLQWEFHLGHCQQCHPHHGSVCLSNLPSRAWLKTSTRLFSSIAAKCLRVCRFFLQQQS